MNTRFVDLTECGVVCRVMRKAKTSNFRTKAQLRAYLESGGQVIATHNSDGAIMVLIFYRIIEGWNHVEMDRTVYCESIVFQCGGLRSEEEQAAKSARVFLRSVLTYTASTRALITLRAPCRDYQDHLEAIGFLPTAKNEICDCCQMMVFSHEPAHVGAVVIERLLAGNAATYGEV